MIEQNSICETREMTTGLTTAAMKAKLMTQMLVGRKVIYSGANNMRRWQAHASEIIFTYQCMQRFS